jgi:hypothetical protein
MTIEITKTIITPTTILLLGDKLIDANTVHTYQSHGEEDDIKELFGKTYAELTYTEQVAACVSWYCKTKKTKESECFVAKFVPLDLERIDMDAEMLTADQLASGSILSDTPTEMLEYYKDLNDCFNHPLNFENMTPEEQAKSVLVDCDARYVLSEDQDDIIITTY